MASVLMNAVLALFLASAPLASGFSSSMPRQMRLTSACATVADAPTEAADLKLDLTEPKFPEQCEFAGISLSR